MGKLVSILYMTIDRWPDCLNRLNANLDSCGVDRSGIEILWADNGSANVRVIEEFSKHPLVSYARVSKENEGVGRTLNQLILRARGEYIVQLGNDYKMPDTWLTALVGCAAAIPSTGMAGIAWSPGHRRALVDRSGVAVHLADFETPIFGVKLKTRAMLDRVGAFDERLHPYGLEDSDYHRRSVLAGFDNYYLPNFLSEHLGHDDAKSDYRLMKDYSLRANGPYFVTKDYARFGYYEPFPAKTEPFKR